MKARDIIVAIVALCFWSIYIAFGLRLAGMDWSVRDAGTGFAYFFSTLTALFLTALTVCATKAFDDK